MIADSFQNSFHCNLWRHNYLYSIFSTCFWLCQGKHQAELFVQDFIITQLIGKDILDLCSINNPMGLLVDVLQQLGQPEPEPRYNFVVFTCVVYTARADLWATFPILLIVMSLYRNRKCEICWIANLYTVQITVIFLMSSHVPILQYIPYCIVAYVKLKVDM